MILFCATSLWTLFDFAPKKCFLYVVLPKDINPYQNPNTLNKTYGVFKKKKKQNIKTKTKNTLYTPRWMQHWSDAASVPQQLCTENWAIKHCCSLSSPFCSERKVVTVSQRLSALPLQCSLEHWAEEGREQLAWSPSERLSQLPVQASGWILLSDVSWQRALHQKVIPTF